MNSLGEALSGLLREYGLEEAVKLHQATNHWEEVVGTDVARNCLALGVKGHTLYVRARNAAWRNEIAFQKEDILQGINERIGSPLLKDLRFTL